MHHKSKLNAATNAAQNAAAAAQDAAAAAQESLKAATHDAAAAAAEAAQQLKNTVKDYFPSSTSSSKFGGKDMHIEMPDKSKVLAFLGVPYMAIIIALVIILLSAFIFMRRRQGIRPFQRLMSWMKMRNRGKSTVLICGPVDSGKTVLFHTLSGGQFQPTQTSMQENVETFKIHPKVLGDRKDKLCDINFEFIDFPGHPSQESHIGKFSDRVQGIVLVVDATSNDSIVHAAKTLFSLLERQELRKKKSPVLVCANKIDANDAIALTSIRGKLLDEINKLKDSRSSMASTSEKGDEDIALIGKSGEKLTWDNLGLTVSFGQISAKQGNLTDFLDFLEGIQH